MQLRSRSLKKKEPPISGSGVGEVINSRYQIIKKLGRGGMGTVFLAADNHHGGRMVALKRVRGDRLDEKILATIRNEFLSLASLRHANVANVYDFGLECTSGDIFFTSEFVEGPDWLKMVQRLSLDSDDGMLLFLDLLVQVLRGLEFVHSRRFVHLDIKPDNVLIQTPTDDSSDSSEGTPTNRPKLIDFGLTKKENDFGGKRIMGTTYYIAPETILGARVDRRTDLYSLGVVLYQLTTGQLPFQGKGNLDVFKGHLEKTPIPPHELAPTIPRQLSTIILCLMEKRPDDRFQSATEVIVEINRELGHSFALETDQTMTSYLEGAKLVGREDELHRLQAILRQALKTKVPMVDAEREEPPPLDDEPGEDDEVHISTPRLPAGRLVILSGEEGLGKRRIIESLRHLVQCQTASVLEVECSNATGQPRGDFYGLVRQIVIYGAQVSRGQGTGFGEEAVTLARELKQGGVEGLDAGFRRRLSNICTWMLEASRQYPFYLHFHDLHLAGPAVSQMVFTMVEILAEERVLGSRVLLSATTLDQADTEGRCLQGLYGSAVFRRSILELQLERLDSENVSRLVRSAFTDGEFSDEFFRRVHEESDGNSDVILDILGFCLKKRIVQRTPLGWALRRDLDQEPIPGKVRRELQENIEKLPASVRALAVAFACLGDATELDLAVRLAGIPAGDVNESVAFLRKKKLLQERIEGDPDRIFKFVHSSARDILYRLIPEEERAAEHDRAGRLCEEYYRSKGVHELKKLAYNFLRARNKQKGVEYGVAAAKAYVHEFRPREAIAIFEEVLELVGESDPTVAHRLRQDAADLRFQVGEYSGALAMLQPLREVDHLDGGLPERSKICLNLARIHGRLGQYEKAASLTQDVIRWQAEESPPEVLAELLLTSAELHAQKGNLVESLCCCDRMMNRKEQVVDPAILGRLNMLLAENHFRLDNQAKAVSYCQEALKLIDTRKGNLSPDLNLYCLAKFYMYGGKLLKAIKQFELSAQVSRKVGASDRRADALLDMGTIYLWLERPQGGLPALKQARALYERSGNISRTVDVLYALGETHRLVGDYDEARTCCGEALKKAKELGNRQARTQALLSYAGLCLDAGDIESAERYILEADSGDFRVSGYVGLKVLKLRFDLSLHRGDFSEAFDHASKVLVARGQGEDRMTSAHLLAQRAMLQCRLGRRMEARQALVMLLDIARTYNSPLCEGRARLLEGLILAADGKGALAEKSFSRAAEIFQSERCDRELVQLYLERGLTFLKSGDFEESYLNFEEGFYLAKKLNLSYMKCRYYLAMGLQELIIPQGQIPRAEEHLLYAERLASQIAYAELLWQIQYYMGKLLAWKGEKRESQAYYAKSMAGRRETTDRIPLTYRHAYLPLTYRQAYLRAAEDRELEALLDERMAEKAPVGS